MQNYELYIIFDQTTSATECDELINSFTTQAEATNINIDREGVKKFAYPINKKWNGIYYRITFDLSLDHTSSLNNAIKLFNKKDSILRHLCVNQTDFLKQKSKEKINEASEFTTHRDLNKGKANNKQCLTKYLGIKAIDYKDTEYLSQFTSPYAKIFKKQRTGTSSKYQRKIATAIKRARHLALMPFTAKWIDN